MLVTLFFWSGCRFCRCRVGSAHHVGQSPTYIVRAFWMGITHFCPTYML